VFIYKERKKTVECCCKYGKRESVAFIELDNPAGPGYLVADIRYIEDFSSLVSRGCWQQSMSLFSKGAFSLV